MRLLVSFTILLMTCLVIACTNLQWDPLTERYDDNFSGGYTTPADIDPAGTNAFTFAVMSDVHVGSPGGQVLGSFLDRSKSAGDAFVVLCGDITDSGQEEQYTELKGIFSSKNITFRSAIGNHDVFFGGWTQFRKYVGRSMYSMNADNVHMLFIDSANGVIGERQLAWIEDDLNRSTAAHKLVFSHFPPWNGTFSSIYKMASEEEAAILKDIFSRTGVEVMFAGHYHGYNEASIGGVKYIVTGGANDLIDPGNHQHYFRVRVNGASLSTEYIPFP